MSYNQDIYLLWFNWQHFSFSKHIKWDCYLKNQLDLRFDEIWWVIVSVIDHPHALHILSRWSKRCREVVCQQGWGWNLDKVSSALALNWLSIGSTSYFRVRAELISSLFQPFRVSLMGMGFDSKWFRPPSVWLGPLLYPWVWSTFFWWDSTFCCRWLLSSKLQFLISRRR